MKMTNFRHGHGLIIAPMMSHCIHHIWAPCHHWARLHITYWDRMPSDTVLPGDQAACDIQFCAGAGGVARGTYRKQGSQLGVQGMAIPRKTAGSLKGGSNLPRRRATNKDVLWPKISSESQRITSPRHITGRIQRLTSSIGELSNSTKNFTSKLSDPQQGWPRAQYSA